jgi:DnaJ-class molecular chaperone
MGKHSSADHTPSQFVTCPMCGGSRRRQGKACDWCHGNGVVRSR